MIKSFSGSILLTNLIDDFVTYPEPINSIEGGFLSEERGFYIPDMYAAINSEQTDLIKYILNSLSKAIFAEESPYLILRKTIKHGYHVYKTVSDFFLRNNIFHYIGDYNGSLRNTNLLIAIKSGSFDIVRYMIEGEGVKIGENHLLEARLSENGKIYLYLMNKHQPKNES